jgi:3-hydroxyisobutyrate dehydrogenase
LHLAESEGAEMPLARSTAERYATAISKGLGGFDGASLTRRTAGK